VTGRHEINVVDPLVPKTEKGVPQLWNGKRLSHSAPTDLVVLTKDTPEIASGEKNRPGPAGTGNAGFFSVMGSGPGYHRQLRGMTEAYADAAVDMALPGALVTDAHEDPSVLIRPDYNRFA